MKITVTSDIHGSKPPKIGEHEGELLIIAGDLTNRGTINEITQFIFNWELFCSTFDAVFIIPGNHDTCMVQPEVIEMIQENIPNSKVFFGGTYEYGGFKFGFMPWSPTYGPFEFMGSEEFIQNKLSKIGQVDILVTHSPPHGIRDKVYSGEHVGSKAMRGFIEMFPPKLHIFGHIHESAGFAETDTTTFINAATNVITIEG